VAQAREVQRARYTDRPGVSVNADAEGETLEAAAAPTEAARSLLEDVARRFRLSARGYHRVLRVARTIADLDASGPVDRRHVAEAAGFRLAF
jgi:magnesium chelatase family protein